MLNRGLSPIIRKGQQGKLNIQDRELLRRFEMVDTLSDKEKNLAKDIFDLVILKHRFQTLTGSKVTVYFLSLRGNVMQTQQEHTQRLFNKIQRLPPEKVAVVDDFVDFLRSRSEADSLVRAAGKLSEKSFQQAWDNRKMLYMTTYKFGDIILVPFPFTDQTTVKKLLRCMPFVTDHGFRLHVPCIGCFGHDSCRASIVF